MENRPIKTVSLQELHDRIEKLRGKDLHVQSALSPCVCDLQSMGFTGDGAGKKIARADSEVQQFFEPIYGCIESIIGGTISPDIADILNDILRRLAELEQCCASGGGGSVNVPTSQIISVTGTTEGPTITECLYNINHPMATSVAPDNGRVKTVKVSLRVKGNNYAKWAKGRPFIPVPDDGGPYWGNGEFDIGNWEFEDKTCTATWQLDSPAFIEAGQRLGVNWYTYRNCWETVAATMSASFYWEGLTARSYTVESIHAHPDGGSALHMAAARNDARGIGDLR